jgi:C4-dicarboxylate-specific signal transduction histidine kinase
VSRPLRQQIVLLNLVILVPIFAVVLWSAWLTRNEQLELVENEAAAVSVAVASSLKETAGGGHPDFLAMQQLLGAIPLPTGSVITITDSRSKVLARSQESARFVGQIVDSQAVPLDQVPPRTIRAGMDGVERVYANEVVEAGPWLVSVGIPSSVAVARVAPIYRRNLGIAVIVTLMTLLVEFVVVRRFIHAFDHLEQAAQRVASGDLRAPKALAMPSQELNRVQATFSTMVTKLGEAQSALAAQIQEERRIRVELESLQQQVIRQERLAAIGVLVSGVAHELNNPLQAILGFAELLQMRRDLPENIQSDLALIQKESTRASAIIRNLSRFGRQQSSSPAPIRLREVVASVVELRQRQIEEQNIRLEVDDRATQRTVAVFTELQQVALNFVINAEYAVRHAPHPRRIMIRTVDVESRVRLEVQDSGPGVPREHEPKLFQPFFTTKPAGAGTGLGLSVSYGIIQSHEGTIGYRPASGGGAIFYFELPTESRR